MTIDEEICSPAGSIRDQLRSSTTALHRKVDEHMRSLLACRLSGYVRFLEASAKAVLPIERALGDANVSAILPDWPQRSRSAALRSDLDALSLPFPQSCKFVLPRDEGYQFGVLYVLEGSRLGARALLLELQRTMTPEHLVATRYLSHGQKQPLWQRFLKRLEAFHASYPQSESAIAGAHFAFSTFLPGSDEREIANRSQTNPCISSDGFKDRK